jgi:hypothetical protein
MQRDLAVAIREATPDISTVRQSWRVQAVIAGKQPVCPTLEAAINERIAAGASEEDVMEIAHVVVRHTRQKLIDARPAYAAMVRSLDSAVLYETQVQGPQDVATVETLAKRCINSLKHLLARTTQQREASEIVIVATQAEIAERERQNQTARSRFGITGNGRAS